MVRGNGRSDIQEQRNGLSVAHLPFGFGNRRTVPGISTKRNSGLQPIKGVIIGLQRRIARCGCRSVGTAALDTSSGGNGEIAQIPFAFSTIAKGTYVGKPRPFKGCADKISAGIACEQVRAEFTAASRPGFT